MGFKKILFLVIVSCFHLFPNSPTYGAAVKDPSSTSTRSSSFSFSSSSRIQSQLVIDDFCNQRRTREDRLFCALVFEPNPQTRSVIKDNLGLLRVGVQFAIGNAMKTKAFLKFLLDHHEDNASTTTESASPPLMMKQLPVPVVLEHCLAAYSDYIKHLKMITSDLEVDPPMVNYDSRMAAQDLSRCHSSLAASKIHDDSILGRNKVAEQYSKLILDISKIL